MATTLTDQTLNEDHYFPEAHNPESALAAIRERCHLSWEEGPDFAKIVSVLVTHRSPFDGWNIRIDAWYEGCHQVYLAHVLTF